MLPPRELPFLGHPTHAASSVRPPQVSQQERGRRGGNSQSERAWNRFIATSEPSSELFAMPLRRRPIMSSSYCGSRACPGRPASLATKWQRSSRSGEVRSRTRTRQRSQPHEDSTVSRTQRDPSRQCQSRLRQHLRSTGRIPACTKHPLRHREPHLRPGRNGAGEPRAGDAALVTHGRQRTVGQQLGQCRVGNL